MVSLHQLNQLPTNRSDKGDQAHSFQGLSYLHHYERHFESLRTQPIKLLEIGVYQGASLRLWRDYFVNGEIHGLDIDPGCCRNNGPRVTVHLGDQANTEALSRPPGPWDIVIDDGSHKVEHIVTSFTHLWPALKPNGFYVVEDMGLSYGTMLPSWPGMRHNTTISNWANDRQVINKWLLGLIGEMDGRQGEVKGLYLHPMIYFIQKKC